jgi:phosphatidylinositol 4-kinase
MCTGANVGLIETLTDSLSFDGIKKKYGSLAQYFATVFGAQDSPEYKKAQQNFISSMAAYSIYCYLFQIKDRHNGNIMLDRKGDVIHIDFGFMFGIAQGGAFSLEEAPFKLTQELVEIMGGIHSEGYQEFKKLFLQGFLLARNEYIKVRLKCMVLDLIETLMNKNLLNFFL